MKKEEIINQETFYKYCYEKAKLNVIKNWYLDNEDTEKIDSCYWSIFKSFTKVSNITLDEELENIIKYYINPEKEIRKCLKKYNKNTSIFIARLEFLITQVVR